MKEAIVERWGIKKISVQQGLERNLVTLKNLTFIIYMALPSSKLGNPGDIARIFFKYTVIWLIIVCKSSDLSWKSYFFPTVYSMYFFHVFFFLQSITKSKICFISFACNNRNIFLIMMGWHHEFLYGSIMYRKRRDFHDRNPPET